MISKLKYLLILAIFATVLSYSHSATAATNAPAGLTVSPAFQDVRVPENSEQVPISFTVFNNRTTAQTIHLSVADFNTLDETGGLFFVGSNPVQIQNKYGLAKWISLPEDQITIPSKQSATIQAQVLNLPTLSSGGHYGALMLQLVTNNANSNENVNVHPIASSLLFITKLGGDTHKLQLTNVTVRHSILSLPSSITLRFKNNGNTHLLPRGSATIVNSHNQVISKGTINQDSNLILPEKYRLYPVQLNQLAKVLAPGKYKVIVNFRFEGTDQYRIYQKSFTYIPIVWLLGLLLIITLLCLLGYRVWANYKSWESPKPSTHK